MAEIGIVIAFLAGLISFISPCVLPIVPGLLSYLSGVTPSDAKSYRVPLFLNSLFFVIGFSLVFALLGVLLQTLLANVAYNAQIWLSRIGGAIIIFFALYLLGVIKLKFLLQEHKPHVNKKFKNSYVTSFVFGAAFAVGWSPCVGAILGGVLALAITQPGLGFLMLLAYAVGLGIPFLILGLFMSEALILIRKSTKFLKYFNIVVGILMLIIGVLIMFNMLFVISQLVQLPYLESLLVSGN